MRGHSGSASLTVARKALLLGLALALCVGGTASASTAAGEFGEVVFEEPAASGSWLRLDVVAEEGATFYVDMSLRAQEFGELAIAEWTRAPYGNSSSLNQSGVDRPRVSVPATGLVVESDERVDDGGMRVVVGYEGAVFPGAYSMVITGGTDIAAASGSLRVHIGEKVRVESITVGDGGFLFTPESMDTVAYAHTGTVEAGAASTREITTSRPLFATLSVRGQGVATYVGPGRANATRREVLYGEPAGIHRFDVVAEVGGKEPAGILRTGWILIGAPAG